MTKLNDLAKLGQAIWLDYIQRGYMQSGELQKLVDMGLRGMTSNPTIFEKAIAGSRDYDADVASLAPRGKSTQEIYEALVADDIRMAADMLLPVYQATETEDGYVSLEVSPELAHDTQGTIDEASRLWSQVDRPNLMIKIPATQEGLPAITRSIASGINVNVTLIFSLERYQDVMEAYLQGLEERLRAGKPLEKIASVASFFVSRLDTKVDERLLRIMKDEEPGASRAAQLLGRAAVNNARLAYQLFDEIFHRPRFNDLASQGARVQRPLWASTSTKNPAYSDILYVQELIGAHTVNTLPQNTLEAFLDHGQVTATIGNELQRAHQEISALDQIGISMQEVTQELEDEGVTAFAKSYQELLTSIETKRADLLSGRRAVRSSLGVYHGEVDESLNRLAAQDILSRIWKQDYTVWKPDPNEITNRLGWLYIANEMENRARQMEAVAFGVRSAGYRHIVLLGMGGSSLAPELFARTFGSTEGHPELSVLDTTDPGAVLELESGIDYAKTAFIVSSKSGGTVETLSLFKYFYQKSVDAFGSAAAGEHFIAITDPGSHLVDIAGSLKFRSVFLNDPDIGGRYSALSYFGLLPAALIGLDLYRLLGSARKMADACRPGRVLDANPAAWLGTILGSLAGMNRDMRRDKLTLVLSPAIASFGDWVEQLIAESTGKAGKGILPVVGEELAAPEAYGDDRLFVSLHLTGDPMDTTALKRLESAGHPVIQYEIDDVYNLGGQFFLWELATAVAGYFMQINPFNQPNVEAAKQRARQMVDAYKHSGSLPEQATLLQADKISVYGSVEADNPLDALQAFLDQAKPGDYVALQAFLTPEESTTSLLQELRRSIRQRTRLATTLGYGPRFLHSTGQLHKGDGGNGLFIQFTADDQPEVPIPDEINASHSSITFGTLKMAQALGDLQALQDAGRRVIRFHLEDVSAIKSLVLN